MNKKGVVKIMERIGYVFIILPILIVPFVNSNLSTLKFVLGAITLGIFLIIPSSYMESKENQQNGVINFYSNSRWKRLLVLALFCIGLLIFIK